MDNYRCQELLHTLFEYSLKPEFGEEMAIARELYCIATGKVNDDDVFYETRMSAFQEYFIFDYRLSDSFSGSTIFETFLFNSLNLFSINELHEFEQLRNFQHSLYSVEKVKDEGLMVKDLFSHRKSFVFPLPQYSFAGFSKNQIFEGRMVNFNGISYFTGTFILYPGDVRVIIEKQVDEFLEGNVFCQASESVYWKDELRERKKIISSVTEQKVQVQQAEKKRAIDILKVTQRIAEMTRKISSLHLIMAIGQNEEVSPYIPETPFYDALPLLQQLAYCEVKSYRYKHIDPVKVYSNDKLTVN